MNKQNVPVVPDENRMEELLEKIQPVPSENFRQKMKQAVWQTKNLEAEIKRSNNHRARFALAFTMLLLVAGLLLSPQGRAWAQELFHFFSRINAQAVEIPESQSKWLVESANISYDLPLVPLFIPTVSPEMAALPGCATPEEAQSYRCRVALAESQLGFDLKELPATPENWKFDFLYFDAASKQAMISYIVDQNSPASGSFLLTQVVGDFPTEFANTPWEVVPADKVEPVKVAGHDGEYVKGSFGTPADKSLAWSDSYIHRLAWSDGARWYGMTLYPGPTSPDLMSRDQLVDLAERLVDSPQEELEALDADALYSVSDVEQFSGVDLKVPTLLPLDIDFEYARYYAYNDEVRLFYGINNELVIYIWKNKSLDFDSRATSTPYEIVEINGEPAFLGSVGGTANGHMFLSWDQDGMLYQIYYAQDLGRTLEKEELIAIAESMQDINDFRKNASKPYEYVSIYEQVLGLDVKEFPETPAEWSYSSVFGDALGRCIGLMYRPVTEPGWLLINQCGTDRYWDVSDIPSNQLQQVQIGKIKGLYAVGDFVTSDNGELAWDADLPVKRLYWQEDGFWNEITLMGESATGHDKEALIAYAERLR
jgi:hypothetical protein